MCVCVCVCVCVLSPFNHVLPTLCDLMDCSPPGSSVREISKARMLEWVAISYSWGSSPLRDQALISCLLHWQADSLLLALHGTYNKPISYGLI